MHGPYIFIATKSFSFSAMQRQRFDEKLKGTIFCLFKSGSSVTKIQRQENINNFDVTRMTIKHISNGHEKERKGTILNKKTRG